MYNGYFGFARRPFASAPQIDQYFPGTVIEAARQTLTRCIDRGEGVAVVVGPSGTGKTLLCHVLAEQFRDSLGVALLSSGRLSTRRNLFQAILYELGQTYRGMDEGELRLALVDHLTSGEDCARGMVLLVDEGHSLPLRLLEEIRMLTNLSRNGQLQVRLVIAGGCLLEERLAHPKLDSLSQRLVARCYLESFNRSETQEYIHAQIDLAREGEEPPTRPSVGKAAEAIVPPETCRSVYQATDGVPRLINQVCDHALLLAYAAGRRQLEPSLVEEAWADLQQLPTPWNVEGQDEQDGGVIEFGGLDDEPTDRPSAAHGTGTSDARVSLPPLRISPETDEQSDAPAAEPAEQLQRIEAMLDSVEDDYQPTRPFGGAPPDPSDRAIGPELELVFEDPFQEEFEKEEVVADRYVQPGGPPREPADAAQRPEQDHAPAIVDPCDGQPVDSQSSGGAGPAVEPAVARHQLECETVPLHRAEPAQAADDPDMIVVEDDYDDPPATCPIVAVRHQEYGRLFTKLRRG